MVCCAEGKCGPQRVNKEQLGISQDHSRKVWENRNLFHLFPMPPFIDKIKL